MARTGKDRQDPARQGQARRDKARFQLRDHALGGAWPGRSRLGSARQGKARFQL